MCKNHVRNTDFFIVYVHVWIDIDIPAKRGLFHVSHARQASHNADLSYPRSFRLGCLDIFANSKYDLRDDHLVGEILTRKLDWGFGEMTKMEEHGTLVTPRRKFEAFNLMRSGSVVFSLSFRLRRIEACRRWEAAVTNRLKDLEKLNCLLRTQGH